MSTLVDRLMALQPSGRLRGPGRPRLLSDDVFRAVEIAHAKGCLWREIFETLDGKYKTVGSLKSGYYLWRKVAKK